MLDDPSYAGPVVGFASIAFGVIAPALGLWFAGASFDRTNEVALGIFFAESMTVLVVWLFAGRARPRFAAFASGALGSAAVFAALFCLAFWPYIGILVLGTLHHSLTASLEDWISPSHWRELGFFMLGFAPILGTMVYLLNASRARRAMAGAANALFVCGALMPAGLVSVFLLVASIARDRCVAAMTVEEPAAAISAAAECRCLTPIASWQAIVDAWLAARDREVDAETPRSHAIADAYQALTGQDLRVDYDDSARH